MSTLNWLKYVPVNGNPTQMLVTIVCLVLGGTIFFSIILRLLGLYSGGLATLLSIVTALVLCPFEWHSLIAAIPFVIGFLTGSSTKVSQDPFSVPGRMAKLTPLDYAKRMDQVRSVSGSRQFYALLISPSVPVPVKLGLQFQVLSAYLYRAAPFMLLAVSPVYFWFWSLLNSRASQFGDLRPLVILLALPFGTAVGMLVKYVRGARNDVKVGGAVLRPTARSFFSSLVWSVSPAVTVVITGYLLGPERRNGITFRIPSIMMLVFAIALIIQDIVVHRQKLVLFSDGIAIWNGRVPYGTSWEDVHEVVIRERPNRFSGVDRLIQIRCNDGRTLAYPISVLSRHDQDRVLLTVRSMAPTKTHFDKGVL